MIFHLALADDWAVALASGSYAMSTRGRSLAEEGFVHAAHAGQVAPVAAAFYRDAGPLLLLVIDPARLDVPVVEEAVGTPQTYPHVYGPIRLSAVVAASDYRPGPSGAFPVVAPPLERQRLAAYAVVRAGGALLLTRNSATTAAPGTWTLPGGGVDHGEHPRDAVIREVYEETGLTVRPGALLEVDSHRLVGFSPSGVLEDLHAVRVVYAAAATPVEPPRVVDTGGSTDATAWVGAGELRAYRLSALARLGAGLSGLLPGST